MPGPERHRAPAGGADGEPSEQDGAGHHARRGHARIPHLELALHAFEDLRLDDGRHFGEYLLRCGFAATAARLEPVERHASGIDGMGQERVQRPEAPGGAAAGAEAAGVEPHGDGLDPHGAGAAVAFEEQPEDQPDGLGLDRIDGEPLLDAAAAPLHLHGLVAERRAGAVPVALASVLLHGAQHVLGVLLGLVLVEESDHLAHHDLRRVVAQLLGDGHQPDAVLGELAHVELEPEGVAEEARERVHDDIIEGVLAVAGALDHLLELGPLVVGGRGAGLDVLGGEGPAALRHPCAGLRPLVGDRQVVLGLAACGDAQVDGNAGCGRRTGVAHRSLRGAPGIEAGAVRSRCHDVSSPQTLTHW